jgi:hypothetical protein
MTLGGWKGVPYKYTPPDLNTVKVESKDEVDSILDSWDKLFPDKDIESVIKSFDNYAVSSAQATQPRGEFYTDAEMDKIMYGKEVDDFLGRLQSAGKTPDTLGILKTIFPEATEQDIDQIFATDKNFDPDVFTKTPEGYNFTVDQDGKETTLTLKPDMTVWQDGKQVAHIDAETGEFVEDNPLWKDILIGALKVLDVANAPFELAGRAREMDKDPEMAAYYNEATVPEQEEYKQFLLSHGAARNMKGEIEYTAVQTQMVMEKYKTELDAIKKKYDDAYVKNHGQLPSFQEAWQRSHDAYHNLPVWEQIVLELPMNVIIAGAAANPAYRALSIAAKNGNYGTRLAAKFAKIPLEFYELGSSLGQTKVGKAAKEFSVNQKGALDLSKFGGKAPKEITPEMKQALKDIAFSDEAISKLSVQDAFDILKQGDEVVEGAAKVTPPASELTTMAKEATETTEGLTDVGKVVAREGFAENINLSKFADEVVPDIKAFTEAHPDLVKDVTRGTVKFADTTMNAEKLINLTGGDPAKLVKKVGQAYSDAEIKAIGGMLTDIGQQINDLRKTLDTPAGYTIENQLKLAQLLEKHNYFQLAAHASRAEAGRALSSLRMIQEALKSNSNPIMEQVLKKIGKENYDEALEAMKGLDWDNPSQVNAFIRQFNQPKLSDYITELYINSILSGPKTHIVNSISNMVNSILSPIERGTSAAVESVLARMQGRPVERFMAEVPADIWGALHGIPEGLRGALETAKTGISPSKGTKWEYRQSAFTGKIGRVINLPTNALEIADNLNYAINYRAAFEAEALRSGRKMGFKGQDLIDYIADTKVNPPADMVIEASNIANYRLFRQEGDKFAEILYKLRDWGIDVPKIGKVAPLKYVIPFVRTPINIAKYGLERSPLAFFNVGMYKNLAAKNPKAADQLARAFIGSTMSAGIALLFAEGKITGAAPTSQGERDRFYREGKQAFSVKVGNKWVSYQRLEPFNTSFTLTAIAVDAINQDDKTADEKAWQAAASFGKNFISQTYMSGLSDIINAVSEPEREGSNIIQSTGQALLVPGSSLMRTAAQAVDPVIRQPSNFVEKLESGIPYLSWRVPPKLNVFGEPSKRTTPWYSPINISEEDNSKFNTELDKLDVNIGFVGNTVDGVELTDSQQKTYQEIAGGRAKELILEVIDSDEYGSMTADEQASAIQSAANQAKADTRFDLMQKGIIPYNQDYMVQLNQLPAQLGTQIGDTPFLAGEKPDIYDTKELFSDANKMAIHVKTSDIKDPSIKAVIETKGYLTTLENLPPEKLISLTSDQIKTYVEKGTLSRQDAELLRQYSQSVGTDRTELLKNNPQLGLNPRESYLEKNTKINALIVLFQQRATLYTKEATEELKKLIDELDIPETALSEKVQGLFKQAEPSTTTTTTQSASNQAAIKGAFQDAFR